MLQHAYRRRNVHSVSVVLLVSGIKAINQLLTYLHTQARSLSFLEPDSDHTLGFFVVEYDIGDLPNLGAFVPNFLLNVKDLRGFCLCSVSAVFLGL